MNTTSKEMFFDQINWPVITKIMKIYQLNLAPKNDAVRLVALMELVMVAVFNNNDHYQFMMDLLNLKVFL